ncbi:hypothetical protein B0T20DRAFT_226080 [Sordaria brevicollis]|uniref:Uncharacterized protein n=1 Tax=Sordaria brevicollis TaxID=83679 RepID=A0AAE0PD60_SORBR|nr:hypothetical protein B0T20DRAFT_226080 [Sordaria brevicollis]
MHNSRFHSIAARFTPSGLRTSLRSRRSRSSSTSSRASSSDGEVERLVSPTSSTASSRRGTLNRAGSSVSSLFGIRLVPAEPEEEDEEEVLGRKELANVLEPRPTDDMYFCSLEEKMQMRSF